MKRLITLLFCIVFCIGTVGAKSKNYTVIVSLDGCRWDYPQLYHTPFFDSMAANGVSATMYASFPSVTFPNHYTLATGLYPDHHGLINNTFYDREGKCVYSIGNPVTRNNPKYYGGEPIWITAERQGVTAASVYWVGSDLEAPVKHASYYYVFSKLPRLTFPERVDKVIDLLSMPEDKRPHFVMVYFEEPDEEGHHFGPQSKITGRMVESLDSLMSCMWTRIQSLPIGKDVNLIITSDHGMTSLSKQRVVPSKKYLKPSWIEKFISGVPVMIYTNPGCADSVVDALKNVPHIRAWRKADIPAYLHFGTNKNVGDVLVLPDLGWQFGDKPMPIEGTHGYDNTCSDMQPMFRAIGPDFKQGYAKQEYFKNVDVYPLLSHLLGITPAPNDGDLNEVEDMLR